MKRIYFVAVFVFSFMIASCFSITVNVYFPERDVKSAFKSLEQQLMKGEPADKGGPPEQKPADVKPQSGIRFEFGPKEACASDAGELSTGLAEKLRSDPAVVAAYKDMGARLGYIDRLRDAGTVGEGSDGLLKPRAVLGKKESVAVSEENANRTTIINSMARAIVELNNQPVTNASVGQVKDKAAAQFASVRAEAARGGWWVQSPGGEWAKK